jgi:hypothetical protein
MNRPLLRRFAYTSVALALALLVVVIALIWDVNELDLPGVDSMGIEPNEADAIVIACLLVIPPFFIDRAVTRQRAHEAQLLAEQLKVLHMTMRTVQDIVSNALMSLYLFREEAEPNVSPHALALFDQIVGETAAKLKAIADLEVVNATQMTIGAGIAYPSVPPTGKA